ncbi:hypothetical protein WOLCODRAFT_156583 [Wolfiporia cocos MD-104 SS10]|uniref:Uncharacterized protein n=1 Tax=Wolfiporia cocos (strain MD-104) TaxID=742152 RepID=A0A2H3J2F5_WOLCO|nr:hypothetical protein WOLCODRAFT_156583 [Wolfiporia cocos MD-104 SS10]
MILGPILNQFSSRLDTFETRLNNNAHNAPAKPTKHNQTNLTPQPPPTKRLRNDNANTRPAPIPTPPSPVNSIEELYASIPSPIPTPHPTYASKTKPTKPPKPTQQHQPPNPHNDRPTNSLPPASHNIEWVIRLGGNIPDNLAHPIPESHIHQMLWRDMSKHAAWRNQNSNLLAVKRAPTGNLVLVFPPSTTRDTITRFLPLIRSILKLPDETIISPNIPWSKLVLRYVPCRPTPKSQRFSDTALLNTLHINPTFSNLAYVWGPRWIRRDENMKDQMKSTVSVAFEDPTGDLLHTPTAPS